MFHRTILPGIALLAVVAAASGARAADDAETAATVSPLLDTLTKSHSASERKQAAAKLAEVAATAVPELEKFLARKRATTEADRRAVLAAINADVPDKKGRFRTPKRETAKDEQVKDDFDWLAALLEIDQKRPGMRDVLPDVAVIRALAASRDVDAARAIFDFAFSEDGLVYRDECGRYLRKMSPYSLPALIRKYAIRKKYSSERRYATYQLERLDKENPEKALAAAADDEQLQVEIFRAWEETQTRWAVYAVFNALNDDNPTLRAAARRAWHAYIAGPPPPEAPKRKLVLPGGEQTDEEEPLWLTSRELARIELARKHEELFGELPMRKTKNVELTKKILDYYDAKRAEGLASQIAAAREAAEKKDYATATEKFARVLAQVRNDEVAAEAAKAYLGLASELEKQKRWREASVAYREAQGLSADEQAANNALAGFHYALGKALEAEGADGSAEFRRAAKLSPRHRGAVKALTGHDPEARSTPWLLYAGIGGGAGALILLIIGLALRRRG